MGNKTPNLFFPKGRIYYLQEMDFRSIREYVNSGALKNFWLFIWLSGIFF